MNDDRYNEPLPKIELDKNRFRVKFCPCGKNNKDGKFVPYIGHENKGYCHSCGETFLPQLKNAEQWNNTPPPGNKLQTNYKQIEYKIKYSKTDLTFYEGPQFTEIETYITDATGIICQYNLPQLVDRLNTFKRSGNDKFQNPAILKGLYSGGTSGQQCNTPAPFLFFDIDVKPDENQHLQEPEPNNKVFDYLKSISVLVWRSNSQKGIAGMIHVPQFGNIQESHKEKHLEISKLIYATLAELVKNETGIDVAFDWQQGKFRQIRYFAEQSEQRTINKEPYLFTFSEHLPKPKPASFIHPDIFKASHKEYETNHFITFLVDRFGEDIASELISRYMIGTSKHWPGATVFWQIDTKNKIRTGRIMLYNPTTCRRVKNPFDHITWVHYVLKLGYKLCLFGEHLLSRPENKYKTVAIVESEKTAIIASLYLPQYVWLAVGGKDGLNADKCSVLKGRTVVLFPDLNGFDKWSSKARELSHIATFTVDDTLERKATTEAERKDGLDLADYLLEFDHRTFAKTEAKDTTPAPVPATVQTPIERHGTDREATIRERQTFSQLLATNAALATLVDRFGLVSENTGQRINPEQIEPQRAAPAPVCMEAEPDQSELIELILNIVQEENHYTRADLIKQIQAAYHVGHDKAAGYLDMVLKLNESPITEAAQNVYYRTGSTPF